MKTKTASMFGILAVLMLVASFIIPSNLATPVEADPGIARWDIVRGPNSIPLASDVSSPFSWMAGNFTKGRELTELVAGGDGRTNLVTYTVPQFMDASALGLQGVNLGALLASPMQLGVTKSIAIGWDPFPNAHLAQEMGNQGWPTLAFGGANFLYQSNVYNVAIAPDDPKFWAVVTSGPFDDGNPATLSAEDAPLEVWITTNAGASWQLTNYQQYYNGLVQSLAVPTANNVGFISCIDISPNYGGRRDVAVGVRNGGLGNLRLLGAPAPAAQTRMEIFVLQSTGFTGWQIQNQIMPQPMITNQDTADVIDLEFSPTYVGDASLALVYATTANVTATWFDVMIRDLDTNLASSYTYGLSIEVKDPLDPPATSPGAATIVDACLELPSDFSGQSPSLRRAYVSIDAAGATVAAGNSNGVYRIDDTYVYELMDTSGQGVNGRRIGDIAYYGTYASGKLLCGEVMGDCCAASVMTWFTDSPTVCPIPCWYPALKPPTGAAGADQVWNGAGADLDWKGVLVCDCVPGGREYGNALVEWTADGTLALSATGYYVPTIGATQAGAAWYQVANPIAWDTGVLAGTGSGVVPRFHDETAFSISRNNGETWNQTNYVDTNLNQHDNFVSWLNDVAIAPDCTTIYLASVSHNLDFPCIAFDSVWRASINPAVVAPLPAIPPVGFFWERVLTTPTALDCIQVQTDAPILRLAPDKDDGELVGWGAVGTRAQLWSPDFGDFWAKINPRNVIADFAFESSTLLWNVDPTAIVQKLPYTGTAWSSAEPDMDGNGGVAHMIAVKPEGKILLGLGNPIPGMLSAMTYSLNGGERFGLIPAALRAGAGNTHVAFDDDFENNSIAYVADDALESVAGANDGGRIYRYQLPFPMGGTWVDNDMMDATNGNCGSGPGVPHMNGYFGLQVAITGGALYGAHAPLAAVDQIRDAGPSGVARTLWPTAGMPKPGVVWDCLNVFVPAVAGVSFTTEPWSLKLCGCLTLDTDTVLYSLDHQIYGVTGHAAYRPAANFGVLWAFTDCFAKKGPTLITADGTLIGCDPVSGRAQEVNLCWEQLCVARGYDLEIAKDADFTIRIIDFVGPCADAGWLRPVDLLEPCVYFPAGGNSDIRSSAIGVVDAVGVFGDLECGHEYFWRIMVREAATAQIIRSPWSEVRSFMIKAGLPVRADYYGLKLLSPDNGCIGCPVQPASFSWSPFKETTKYKFVLATDAAMTSVVAEAEVPTTAYEYDGTLDYSTNYFWRVMSLEPAPSDWSATFSLQTEAAPAPPAAPESAPPTPIWVWVVIAIGAILVIVTLVLIFKTRRV